MRPLNYENNKWLYERYSQEVLEEALEALPQFLSERDYQIVEMRFDNGLTYNEISKTYSISVVTVKTVCDKAEKTYRKLVNAIGNGASELLYSLPMRTFRLCYMAELYTFKDVADSINSDKFGRIRGVGKTTCIEIISKLNELGYELNPDVVEKYTTH